MAQSLLRPRAIAVVWSFDKTLTSNSIRPLFTRFRVDEKVFWSGVDRSVESSLRQDQPKTSQNLRYLESILAYTQAGTFDGLNNSVLFELGSEIPLYDGLPEFLDGLQSVIERVAPGVSLEHYIVSTALSKMIMGSRIAPYLRGVWACEFDEAAKPERLKGAGPLFEAIGPADPVLSGVRRSIDSSAKVQVLCDINRGTDKRAASTLVDVRSRFQNMIYIGGGPSNGPAFNAVNQCGGRTFAVYEPRNASDFQAVEQLRRQNLVQGIGEASYLEGSLTTMWIMNAVRDLALRIAEGSVVTTTVGPGAQTSAGRAGTTMPRSPVYPEFSARAEGPAREIRAAALGSASWPRFAAACKEFLGKNFEKHEATFRARHDNYIGSFCDRELSGFMAELERSASGTPSGRQRRAAASDNSDPEKLLSFLEKLYWKHKIV